MTSVSKTVMHISRYRLGPDNRPEWSDVVGVGMFKIRPGAVFDRHYHDFDEYWLVYGGKGRVQVGAEISYVQAGDVVCTPTGTTHDILEVYEDLEAFYFEEPLREGGHLGHLHRAPEDAKGHGVLRTPLPADFPAANTDGIFGA